MAKLSHFNIKRNIEERGGSMRECTPSFCFFLIGFGNPKWFLHVLWSPVIFLTSSCFHFSKIMVDSLGLFFESVSTLACTSFVY